MTNKPTSQSTSQSSEPQVKAPYTRPTWDEWAFDIARAVATRASCPRAHMGFVVMDPTTHRLLAEGYNGAPPDWPDCYEAGCEMSDDGKHCTRTVHAETNALVSAARHGLSLVGGVGYLVGPREVCLECAKLLYTAGVTEIRTHPS